MILGDIEKNVQGSGQKRLDNDRKMSGYREKKVRGQRKNVRAGVKILKTNNRTDASAGWLVPGAPPD